MGACGSEVCVGKKQSSQQRRPNTIRAVIVKPTKRDLDSSMDNYEEKIRTQNDLLAQPVDCKRVQIGAYFGLKHLPAATDASYEEWDQMVKCCLQEEIAEKVYAQAPQKDENGQYGQI